MKADDSMPFFGTLFFEATEGYSDAVALGYIRALWHYWNHTHCQGLPDDDEYLQRVCRCDTASWVKTKGIIFDNQFFFCKNGTHWHQKKAKELHAREIEIYQRRVASAENARVQKATYSSPDYSPVSNPSATPQNGKLTQAQVVLFSREHDRVLERLAHLSNLYEGGRKWAPKDAEERTKLRARREELRQMLGVVA